MRIDRAARGGRRRQRAWRTSIVLPWLLLASACGPAPDSSARNEGERASAPPSEEPALPSNENFGTTMMQFREQVAFARNDLAQRLSVPPDSVTVSNARPVSWRTSALGCPRPERMYADVLTPGVQILLRVGDDLYAYHAAVGKEPFNCPLDRVEVPVYDEDSDQL